MELFYTDRYVFTSHNDALSDAGALLVACEKVKQTNICIQDDNEKLQYIVAMSHKFSVFINYIMISRNFCGSFARDVSMERIRTAESSTKE